MRIALLYPGRGKYDALHIWAKALSRFCSHADRFHARHEIIQVDTPLQAALGFGAVFVLTAGSVCNREWVDRDIKELGDLGLDFGVLHNETNPAVPSPGHYPSFVWTQPALVQLADYDPALVRQPIFPRIVPEAYAAKLHLATFGIAEPKKQTAELAFWATRMNIPFTAFVPNHHEAIVSYGDYLDQVRLLGGKVVVHPWKTNIEDLAPLFKDVSHFIFSLIPTKGGTGGSSTSARYAPMFGRPVIVVDDENTLAQDGFCVARSLEALATLTALPIVLPSFVWSPDAYFDTLVSRTAAFWSDL